MKLKLEEKQLDQCISIVLKRCEEHGLQMMLETFEKWFEHVEYDENAIIITYYVLAYLPIADLLDNTAQDLYSYIEHGYYLVTNDLIHCDDTLMILNYIVFPRVNEEEITPCRQLFYDTVNEQLQFEDYDVDDGQLAIILNKWCACHVAYAPSDQRCLDARSIYEIGKGRCGEETVFAVNVFRSLGFAARQVYASWWSHCDDNHAWMEVYIDGQWKFFGACEPYEILNKGWFNLASSRAMFIGARVFSDLDKSEPLICDRDCSYLVNRTTFYCDTTTLLIKVLDIEKKPVANADVNIAIINHNCSSSCFVVKTNKYGEFSFDCGIGTLAISITHPKDKKQYYYGIVDTKDNHITCQLKDIKDVFNGQWIEYTCKAPLVNNKFSEEVDPQLLSFQQEQQAFVQQAQKQWMQRYTYDLADSLREKRNVKKEIIDGFIDGLSLKDRVHFDVKLFNQSYKQQKQFIKNYDPYIYGRYVLNPRISYEEMCFYFPVTKSLVDKYLEDYEDPMAPIRLIDEFTEYVYKYDPQFSRASRIITPYIMCYGESYCNDVDKEVYKVAMARSYGIAARLNPNDYKSQYYMNDCWNYFDTHQQKLLSIQADFNCVSGDIAINRLEHGLYKQLHTSIENNQIRINLHRGYYQVIQSKRLKNGDLKVRICNINLSKKIQLSMYAIDIDLSENLIDSVYEDFYVKEDSYLKSIQNISKDHYQVLLMVNPYQEPSNHTLNELSELLKVNSNDVTNIHIIVKKDALTNQDIMNLKQYPLHIGTCNLDKISEPLARSLFMEPNNYPYILIVKDNRIYYGDSGYHVNGVKMAIDTYHYLINKGEKF